MFFVYILQNDEGNWYIGQTHNLARRLGAHNSNTVQSTKKRGPRKLIYSEELNTRADAMRREKYLKSGRGRLFLKIKIPGSGVAQR